MYIRTYVFVSSETIPVIRIQILIDPTFNNALEGFLPIFVPSDSIRIYLFFGYNDDFLIRLNLTHVTLTVN